MARALHKRYKEAENLLRRASRMAPEDEYVLLSLGEVLLFEKQPAEAVAVLSPRAFHDDDDSTLHGELLEMLVEALHRTGAGAGVCAAALGGVLIDPRSQVCWDAVRGCRPSELEAAMAGLPTPGQLSLFKDVLLQGPASAWTGAAISTGSDLYARFAEALDTAGRPVLAKRYRELAGMALVQAGVDLARKEQPESSVQMFASAEAIAGLENLPLKFHLAAVRDLVIGYSRLRCYLEAMEATAMLFEFCHSDPEAPDKCPVRAVATPMFAASVITEGMPQALPIHMRHLALVLRDARANVSFNLDTGVPRYKDGHDFVGEKMNAPLGHGAPYAMTSPEEDRVLFITFSSDKKEAKRRIEEAIETRRFELPVKLLLSELGFLATLAAPVTPEVVATGVLDGIPIDQIRSSIEATPPDMIPEPTLLGFKTALRAIALFKQIDPWISGVSNGAKVRILPPPPE